MADTCGINTLLKAWRERWTPLKWLIEVKKNAKSEDYKGLADCLVQQATFGTTPTMLILSYLKHGIIAEVIPSSRALEAIQKFQNIEKHRCLTALLDLLISFIPNMSCHDDDALQLAVAMVKLIYWVLIVAINLLKLSREASVASNESGLHYHLKNAKRCHKAFTQLMSSATYRSLIIVGKLEDQGVVSELDFQFQTHMKEFYVLIQSDGMVPEVQVHFKELMIDYNRLHNLSPTNGTGDLQPGAIPNMAVQNIIHIQNLKFSTYMPEKLADLLEAVMRTQNITRPQLYLEVLRSSLVGMLDSQSKSMEEALWTGFFFLKLPKILSIMENRYQIQSSSPTPEHTLMQATLQQLRVFSPLLDDVDQKFKCNTYKEFIQQYCKYVPSQVADRLNNISSLRTSINEVNYALNGNMGQVYQPLKLLLEAESKVLPILQLLETSETAKDDKFLTQLSSLFNVIQSKWKLVAVASLSKMQNLVSALIRLTEETKHLNDNDEENSGRSCQLRGNLFNAAFIILCHVAQVFGQEVIVEVAQSCGLEDAFMTQWILSHIPESDQSRTFYPNPQYPPNPSIVTLLLSQFYTKGPFMTSDARWDDLCCNVPIAMHEMLKTWQYESHSPAETVQKLVNHIKYEVPAWAICVCAWCCGYIHELRMEQRAFLTSERSENTDRPSQPGLLQFLLSPINDRGMDPVFNDRCSMMVHVMQCMSANIDRKDDAPGSSLPVEINQTPSKVMQQLFNNCIKQKHFSTKILHKFKQLLILGGAEWFCSTIVKELLSFSRQEDISYAADMGSCLMLLDTSLLVPVLIRRVIPLFLHHSNVNVILQDPKGWGIARLAAHAVNWGLLCEQKLQTTRHYSNSGNSSEQPQPENLHAKSPGAIQNSLVWLCEELVSVVEDNKVGPVAVVLKNFLQQAAQCSSPASGSVLACLPTGLTQNLLGLTPVVCCTPDVVLGICSLQSTEGRKLCARVLCRSKQPE